jgi:hypothetical protein
LSAGRVCKAGTQTWRCELESKLKEFEHGNVKSSVEFVGTIDVKAGVICDIYKFTNDLSRDLAIVRVLPGYRTPLQRVVGGDDTIEGGMSGQGVLTITSMDGSVLVYTFRDVAMAPVSVRHGELMQWYADTDEQLVFYEICSPPYEQGRFEDI